MATTRAALRVIGVSVLLAGFGCAADPASPADDTSNSSSALGAKADLASVKARASATGTPATIRHDRE